MTNKKKFIELLANAEFESDQRSIKSKEVYDFRKQQGHYVGNAPYGKKCIISNGIRTLVTDDDELKIIESIILSNLSNKSIADNYNKIGVLKRGKLWTTSKVRTISNRHIIKVSKPKILKSKVIKCLPKSKQNDRYNLRST